MQKRAIAVHDISCVGRCSLTVALPVLSAVGVETSVLPTAVLSTHTGGFTGYTFRDLTEDIMPIMKHWQSLNLQTDAIYTGYLGSYEQLELMARLFDMFKGSDTKILVDPVMADNGKMYPAFSPDFAVGMKQLCQKADIIVPNLTEAVFMLGERYIDSDYSKDYIQRLLVELADLGPSQVVLSGISFAEDQLGAAAYDKQSKQFYYYFSEKIDGYYHGTGDVFGSALLAAIMKEKSLDDAIRIAVEYTVSSIRRTRAASTEMRYGVDFENGLADLIAMVE